MSTTGGRNFKAYLGGVAGIRIRRVLTAQTANFDIILAPFLKAVKMER